MVNKNKAILYRGSDSDLSLPIRILRAEGLSWEIEDDIPAMLLLSDGTASPTAGWFVWLPHYNEGAGRWTGLYRLLGKHGLLLD